MHWIHWLCGVFQYFANIDYFYSTTFIWQWVLLVTICRCRFPTQNRISTSMLMCFFSELSWSRPYCMKCNTVVNNLHSFLSGEYLYFACYQYLNVILPLLCMITFWQVLQHSRWRWCITVAVATSVTKCYLGTALPSCFTAVIQKQDDITVSKSLRWRRINGHFTLLNGLSSWKKLT